MNASEEHNPAPRSAESITYSRVSTWSKVGLGFALIALMLVAVRAWGLTHYVKVFEDFATELPQLTLWIMQVPPLGYLAGCIATAVILIWKEFVLRDKGMTLIINAAAMGVALVFWVTLQYAITLPMHRGIYEVGQ